MAKRDEPSAGPNYGEDFGHDFQRHILAVAARIPGFVQRRRDVLSHRYFVAETHRMLAEVLLDHIDRHNRLPTRPTLQEDVRAAVGEEDLDAMTALIRTIYREDVQDAAAVEERIIAFGKRQAMLQAVLEGAEKIDHGDPSAVEPLIRKAMLVGENLTDLGTDFAASVEHRAALYRRPEKALAERIPTGIPHVDYAMRGGLARRALGVIVAPPKRGKTTVLVNFGYGALTDLAGLNVIHYTCEMPQSQVIGRYDDRLLGTVVRSRKSKPNRLASELLKRTKSAVHGRLLVKEYPTRTATVDTLRSHLSIVSANGYLPDLVIVDYAGILRPTGRRDGEERHLQASIYQDLRALAGEFNCAVWTAQQANRGSLDKDTIGMSDLAECFESAGIADAMWAVCQTVDERADGTCRLFGAAFRDAEDQITVTCRIDRELCRVTSTSLEDVARSRIYTSIDPDQPADDQDPNPKPRRLAEARRAIRSPSVKREKAREPSKKVPKQ